MDEIKEMTLTDIFEALNGSTMPYAFARRGFTSLKIDLGGRAAV